MDWEFVAPMVVAVTLFLSIAGVLIFRPLTKRLGDLIDVTSRSRQGQLGNDDLGKLTDIVNRLTDRIENLEERQDFAERILTSLSGSAEQAQLNKPSPRQV